MEPLKNTTDDPRIRLLNRLYARKRKELKERAKLKVRIADTLLYCLMFTHAMYLIKILTIKPAYSVFPKLIVTCLLCFS